MISQRQLIFACAFFFVLSLVGAFAQAAQPPASPSPESVVQSYLQALKSGRNLAVAELMHPEALEKFRTLVLPLVEESAGVDQESLLPLFRDVPDTTALKKLSPAALFAAFLGGIADVIPGLKETLASGSIATLGSVPEGDVIHVVCRTTVGVEGMNLSKMEVVSVKRSAESWGILLSGDLEGMVQALRNAQSGKT